MSMDQQSGPRKHQLDIQWSQMKRIKQQILDIRERKLRMPKIPDPTIVISFDQLYTYKSNEIRKKIIKRRIDQKQKQFNKINGQLDKYKQKYIEKEKLFKEKEHILQVLTKKLQVQYQKTKSTFREVGFNRSFTTGVRKLNFYKIGQIIFNQNARRVFGALENTGQQTFQNKNDQEIGICLGYLGLLISVVGQLSDARVWFDFIFKGSKSTVRIIDGTHVILRPRQQKFELAMNTITQQAYQIIHQCFDTRIQKSKNLYQLYQICEQLSKNLLA